MGILQAHIQEDLVTLIPILVSPALELITLTLPKTHCPAVEALVAMGFEGQNPSWRDIKGRPSFCYHDIWVSGAAGKINVMVVDTFADGRLGMLK